MPDLTPPRPEWFPELEEESRAYKWRYAAGWKKDGSEKSRNAHDQARNRINHRLAVRSATSKTADTITAEDVEALDKQENMKSTAIDRRANSDERLEVIRSKSVRERTYEEHKIIKKADGVLKTAHTYRTQPLVKALRAVRAALPENVEKRKIYASLPENKAKSKVYAIARAAQLTKKKLDKAHAFINENGINIDIDAAPLSDRQAFQYILSLIDDTDSAVGQYIFHVLDGMTLRTAFWEGKSDSAMYALMSRGDAMMGASKAESIRFLVANKTNMPTLTNGDTNKRFKYTEQQFKDLQLVYCPIAAFNTYSDVTTLESAFQLFFDFLEVGSQRLWKVSGVGNSILPLRKCDRLYTARTNDKDLRYMFGITVMKNVVVTKRAADAHVNDAVVSITGGLGTKCNVNQGSRRAPIRNDSQHAALIDAHSSLPRNFREMAKFKRKADALD
jgi:hypothetical protein